MSHGTPAQEQTFGLDLKITCNSWEKFGTRMKIDEQQVEPPSLTIPGSSRKLQASSCKRLETDTIKK